MEARRDRPGNPGHYLLKGSGLLPGVLTGKLSDVAGLVVAPLLLAALLRVRTLRAWAACHVGFRLAAERAAVGDGGGALNLLSILRSSVTTWLSVYPDADIQDDLRYVTMFIDNLVAHGA